MREPICTRSSEPSVSNDLEESLRKLGAIVFLAVLSNTGHAQTPNPAADALFRQATDELAAGEALQAAENLTKLAELFPDDSLADDALFLAGQTFEEKLSDPTRAHAAYRLLLDRYPRSRSSIAAQRRLERLSGSVQGGQAAALAKFLELQRLFPERGQAWSIHRAEEILEHHPDWADRGRVQLWLGHVHSRAGRNRAAAVQYEAAETSRESSERFEASIGLALVRARVGDFSGARKALSRAEADGLPPRVRALEDASRQVDQQELRELLFIASVAIIFACMLGFVALLRHTRGSWMNAAASLLKPPTEVIYLFPVALLLLLISLTGHHDIGPAIAIIAGGGVLTTWLSGSGLPTRASRKRHGLHAAMAATAVGALTYVALHRNHLLDMIIETVRFGPEV